MEANAFSRSSSRCTFVARRWWYSSSSLSTCACSFSSFCYSIGWCFIEEKLFFAYHLFICFLRIFRFYCCRSVCCKCVTPYRTHHYFLDYFLHVLLIKYSATMFFVLNYLVFFFFNFYMHNNMIYLHYTYIHPRLYIIPYDRRTSPFFFSNSCNLYVLFRSVSIRRYIAYELPFVAF